MRTTVLSALVTRTSSPERFPAVFPLAGLIARVAVVPGAAMRFPRLDRLEPTTPRPTAPHSATVEVRQAVRQPS